MKLLNTELLLSPYNWLTILLMLLFGFMLVALISPQQG